MAGYVFTIGCDSNASEEVHRARLHELFDCGVYSTMMDPSWNIAAAGTLGDFITMKPGDNVYFFSKRKVYGIGEVLDVGDGRAVTENFKGATTMSPIDIEFASTHAIVKGSNEKVGRWVVAFGPAPCFFDEGIDMDDLLLSDSRAFRSLRVFQQRTFIKLDDEENLAFVAAFLRRNLDSLENATSRRMRIPEEVMAGEPPDVEGLLANKRTRSGRISEEMLLEVGLLHQLTRGDERTIDVFGRWDYISHQVHASPFKPVSYMDKMDVFAYRWIKGYERILEGYLVAELKKGVSSLQDVFQVMKYVDWVRSEYANGDYSMVRAFLVAYKYEDGVTNELSTIARRDYLVGGKSVISRTWSDITLVTYKVMENGYIEFNRHPS